MSAYNLYGNTFNIPQLLSYKMASQRYVPDPFATSRSRFARGLTKRLASWSATLFTKGRGLCHYLPVTLRVSVASLTLGVWASVNGARMVPEVKQVRHVARPLASDIRTPEPPGSVIYGCQYHQIAARRRLDWSKPCASRAARL